MHVNKTYAHVRTSYSVEAAEVVRVGLWVCVDGVGDPSVAADDVASDGGDCDAAQHKNEINILCGRSKNYLPQDVETLMSTTHR